MVLFVVFSLLNLKYLPLIDFLPYKVGNNIPEKWKYLKGKNLLMNIKQHFFMRRTVQKKEFTLENYPADDSTWKFVDQKSVLIKKGYLPPIHDFNITTMDGEDITDRILTNEGFTLLMISKKLEKQNLNGLKTDLSLGQSAFQQELIFI